MDGKSVKLPKSWDGHLLGLTRGPEKRTGSLVSHWEQLATILLWCTEAPTMRMMKNDARSSCYGMAVTTLVLIGLEEIWLNYFSMTCMIRTVRSRCLSWTSVHHWPLLMYIRRFKFISMQLPYAINPSYVAYNAHMVVLRHIWRHARLPAPALLAFAA